MKIDATTGSLSLQSGKLPGGNTSTTGSSSSLGGISSIGGGSAIGAPSGSDSNSWFAALAKAWGQSLDQEASRLTELSDQIGNGGQDQPSVMTQMSAESMRMQFMSNSAATSTNSVGQALESLGRKQ